MENIVEKKRKRIDALDARLAPLLAARLRAAASLKGLKKKVRDTAREAEVLARAAALVKDGKLRPAALSVYREIIRQSRLLQERS
jgi:chorismate mutase